MDHVARWDLKTFRDLGVAGLAAAELAAFSQQLRPSGIVNRAIDTAAAEQRRIRCVDDRINA